MRSLLAGLTAILAVGLAAGVLLWSAAPVASEHRASLAHGAVRNQRHEAKRSAHETVRSTRAHERVPYCVTHAQRGAAVVDVAGYESGTSCFAFVHRRLAGYHWSWDGRVTGDPIPQADTVCELSFGGGLQHAFVYLTAAGGLVASKVCAALLRDRWLRDSH